MAVLRENWGPDLRYWFREPQKALPSAEPRRIVWRILRQNRCARLGGSLSQQPPKIAESLVPRGAKSRMRRTETPKPIWRKVCMMVDITDAINYTSFGDHRLRGFWVAGVKFSPFP